ncbi:polyprenyl synthetase family protein [Rubripirellula amarantea]|nr:polyprenyl synthetase family protein [Rubripirellula amarantea]
MDLTSVAGDTSRPSAAHQTGSIDESNARGNRERLSGPRTKHKVAEALLAKLYGPILGELVAVEQQLNSELQSPYEAIGQLLRHGTQLGGKRIRPALVMLSGKCVGETTDMHVTLGSIIEMVHTATLIHDDVLDEAEVRRHVSTVNAKWSNHTSILLGDYLFSQAFCLAAKLTSLEACQWVGEAARLVCEGEMRQVLQRDALDIDEETYFDILRGKTAELCRVSCELGARTAGGTDDEVEAMGTFGNALGIAFQIADDFLDLWGSDETVGKTLGTDIEQGKITLPIIRLLSVADPKTHARALEILKGPSDKRVEAILPFLDACDARAYTEATAQRFRQVAVDALAKIPDSAAKESLLAIADFSVERRF